MSPSKTQIRAGAGKVDISPAADIQIAGSIGWRRPCSGVADPIYAHALVLEQAGRQFCILSVDVLAVDIPWANEIRQRVHQLTGIPREAVLLHATQNHSAPDIGNDFCHDSCKLIPDELPWVRGGDPRYNEPAVAGILESVHLAVQRLTPVRVAAGRAVDVTSSAAARAKVSLILNMAILSLVWGWAFRKSTGRALRGTGGDWPPDR